MKVLLFSPVCKSLEIFKLAVKSFLNLDRNGIKLDYLFLDDNTDSRTSGLLSQLIERHENVQLLDFQLNSKTTYKNHDWDGKKIDRIIAIKNAALAYALNKKYDFVFLVDADLVLHPHTLQSLLASQKHFIFTIFWTKFRTDSPYTPNAWDYHSWNYHSPDSYFRLKNPGIYEVGGGGACTLLSKEILQKGLSFERLLSLNFPGEDRHFCTRAQALGYAVHVDTSYPAYHLFTEDLVEEANEWYNHGANPHFFDQWLTDQWEKEVKARFEFKDNFGARFKKFLFDIKKSYKLNFSRD